MIFLPPKFKGLIFGLTGIGLILALDIFLLALVRAASPSFLTFIAICLLIATGPVLAWLGYRCYGLGRARYILSRNALVVDWGTRRDVIPLEQIGDVYAGADFEGELRPRGLNWPGSVVGHAVIPSFGSVEFLATTEKSGLVLIQRPEAGLAISPEDPQAFLAAFSDVRAAGPEEKIEPESLRLSFEQWAVWHDRLALILISAGGLSALLLFGYLTLLLSKLPASVALHFDAQGLPDRFGAPTSLFSLPLAAAGAWTLNTLGGLWLHRSENERTGAYLLFGATIVVQVLVWGAALGLTVGSMPTSQILYPPLKDGRPRTDDGGQPRSILRRPSTVFRRFFFSRLGPLALDQIVSRVIYSTRLN